MLRDLNTEELELISGGTDPLSIDFDLGDVNANVSYDLSTDTLSGSADYDAGGGVSFGANGSYNTSSGEYSVGVSVTISF